MDGISIVRSDDLRHQNRHRLLKALRVSGPCSPAQLSELTGLSATSVSLLTSQMSDQRIVRSTRQKVNRNGTSRGRPQSIIAVNGNAGDVVTLSLTIDCVRVQRVNYAGIELYSNTQEINTRILNNQPLIDVACAAVQLAVDHDAKTGVHHIGVAFQGVTEHLSGTLAWSPIIGGQNVDLGAALQSTFQLPVSINNDCQLISEALSKNSSDTLGNSFATLLFSHGVGLGLYIDGKPFSGIHSSALELGHLRFERNGALCRCGRKGCIEAYAADYGIERLATGQSIHDDPSGRVDKAHMQALCEAGMAGDKPAIQAFAVAGAAIGEGLATIFTLLDPMPVAMVGRNTQALSLMKAGVKAAFRDSTQAAVNVDELLYCFDDTDPLLEQGLMHNTLARLDKQFAYSGLTAEIS